MSVSVNGLSFGYSDDRDLISDITFHVRSGDCHAILGASGCGKSTLLKLIAGVQSKPSSGSIEISGYSVCAGNQEILDMKRTGRIGYLPQRPILFPHMTVQENISFPSQQIGIFDDAKIQELIVTVGLSGHENKKPAELSGGMLTRTALARLFSTQPEILLLDEPFSSLDIARRADLYTHFQYLSQKSETTTILVTHDIFEALVFSPNVSLMNLSGKITSYSVQNWRQNLGYHEAVESYFGDFANIAEIISRRD